ncbi:hypothetical protein GCM10008910_11940 [Faecalicatena orotica]
MPNRCGSEVPHHRGGHHDREDYADDGVFRAENKLKDIDIGNDKKEAKSTEAEVILYHCWNFEFFAHE